MDSATPKLSTFERSCQHWSEEGRKGMEAFYRLAGLDYQLLAQEIDWGKTLQRLSGDSGAAIRLLDVACGSGQFPDALLNFGGLEQYPELRVAYSLLDPSEFSIQTARQKLRGPFEPADEFCCTAQELRQPDDKFAVFWATHALYCVPENELSLALDRILDSLDMSGLGFIAHASQESHYLQFHATYIRTQSTCLDAYCTGEQVIESLQAKLETDVVAWPIEYEGRLPLDDRETAELYLQRCLFDDTISLDTMLADAELGRYLSDCMDHQSNLWKFRQKTWLIFLGEQSRNITPPQARHS